MNAPRVLLCVSGEIPDDLAAQVERGDRPRADYVEIARELGADLLDQRAVRAAQGRVGRLIERVAGPHAAMAWECHRRRHDYDVIFTDGEQVGLPLAMTQRVLPRRGARHVMIVHILTAAKKQVLFRRLRLGARIDHIFVYCSRQRDLIVEQLRYPAAQITLTPFMVDTQFFSTERVDASRRPMICAAGLERRDYPTLIEAVRGLDVEVVIAAASPWSKQGDTTAGVSLPANVDVRRLEFAPLRQLYADSRFVVMPLQDVDFQAGITTILEAMSMQRAVICTRTPGQTDTVVDGESGVYVPIGDVTAMRAAIERLLADPDAADELGRGGRRYVEAEADIGVYAARLARVVEQVAGRV